MIDPIEIQLRSTLRSAVFPAAPNALRELVHDLPAATVRPAWRPSPLLVAATVSLLLVGLISAIYFASERPTPSPMPSVTPSPTQAAALHDLLTDFRTDQVLLDVSEGQPDQRISNDQTMKTVDLGTIDPPGPFVAALSCRGPGPLTIEFWYPGSAAVPTGAQPTTGRLTLAQWQTECSGTVELNPLPFTRTDEMVHVELTVPRGASWRVAVGAYPERFGEAPRDLGSLQGTDGWFVLTDAIPGAAAMPLSPTAVTVNVPSNATTLGAIVWCDGDTELTVTANLTERRVTCPTIGVGQRVEFPVPGGGTYTVKAQPDAAAWVRMLLETDGTFVSSYPSAPPLPAAVGNTSYASVETSPFSTGGHVAVGRIGSNEQAVIETTGLPVVATAKEDYVAVIVMDRDANHWIELWTVDAPQFVTTVGEQSGVIAQVFLDTTHDRVFYLTWVEDGKGAQLRTVGLDGTDDRVLAAYPTEAWNGSAALAADDSALVAAACLAGDDCRLTVIDTADLTTTEHTIAGDWLGCNAFGVASEAFAAQCYSDEGDGTVIGNLDGSDQRSLTGLLPGSLVATQTGPALVFSEWTTPDGGSWAARDLTSDVETRLFSFGSIDLDANLYPAGVALPLDWVLFATELGEFPATETMAKPVPRLVNVRTGEVILLENLPHAPPLD